MQRSSNPVDATAEREREKGLTRPLSLGEEEREEGKVPDAAVEEDAQTLTEATNSAGDEGTYEKENDFRGKGSADTAVKEEVPDWTDPAGDVAPVTPPSPFEATDVGEAAPVTPSLLEEDETVDVGLKQLWPMQAAWSLFFHSVTPESLRQE